MPKSFAAGIMSLLQQNAGELYHCITNGSYPKGYTDLRGCCKLRRACRRLYHKLEKEVVKRQRFVVNRAQTRYPVLYNQVVSKLDTGRRSDGDVYDQLASDFPNLCNLLAKRYKSRFSVKLTDPVRVQPRQTSLDGQLAPAIAENSQEQQAPDLHQPVSSPLNLASNSNIPLYQDPEALQALDDLLQPVQQ